MEELMNKLKAVKEFLQYNIKNDVEHVRIPLAAIEAQLSLIEKRVKATYKSPATCSINLRERPKNLSYKPGHIFSKNCMHYNILPDKRKISNQSVHKIKKENLTKRTKGK